MQVGLFFKPPQARCPEVFQVLKVSAAKQIFFHLVKWRLNFPFCLRISRATGNRFAVIMRDKSSERRVKDWPAAFPSQHYCFFIIVEALPWYAAIILERILMAADKAVEVLA